MIVATWANVIGLRAPRQRVAPKRSAELGNGPAAIADDRLRSTLEIGPMGAEVDLEMAEHGGRDIGGDHATVSDVISLVVRAADDLTVRHSSAGDQD